MNASTYLILDKGSKKLFDSLWNSGKYNNDESFKEKTLNRLDLNRQNYYNNRSEKQSLSHNAAIQNGILNYINSLTEEEKAAQAMNSLVAFVKTAPKVPKKIASINHG